MRGSPRTLAVTIQAEEFSFEGDCLAGQLEAWKTRELASNGVRQGKEETKDGERLSCSDKS